MAPASASAFGGATGAGQASGRDAGWWRIAVSGSATSRAGGPITPCAPLQAPAAGELEGSGHAVLVTGWTTGSHGDAHSGVTGGG
ncbi:MAG: hypothetical protein ABSC16_04225 [Candidatus Dormibacteria bacterium]